MVKEEKAIDGLENRTCPIPEGLIREAPDDLHYLPADGFRDLSVLGGKHEHLTAGIDADVVLSLDLENELRALDYLISLSFELGCDRFDVDLDAPSRDKLVEIPTARPDRYELALGISG